MHEENGRGCGVWMGGGEELEAARWCWNVCTFDVEWEWAEEGLLSAPAEGEECYESVEEEHLVEVL